MLTFVNSIILTKTQALVASLFVQLAVKSMQQMFGGPCRVVAYEINSFYAEMSFYLSWSLDSNIP